MDLKHLFTTIIKKKKMYNVHTLSNPKQIKTFSYDDSKIFTGV